MEKIIKITGKKSELEALKQALIKKNIISKEEIEQEKKK